MTTSIDRVREICGRLPECVVEGDQTDVSGAGRWVGTPWIIMATGAYP